MTRAPADPTGLQPLCYQRPKMLTRRAADGQPFDDNVLKSLMRKSAAQRPLFFSKVPPGLFEHLMMANMQKEEAIR